MCGYLSDAIPIEYRSASPGFNWGWEYDYEGAMRDPGKFGGEPWPWPAKKTGNRIILPLNQPLITDGLEITFKGMVGSDDFRLDIKLQSLDTGVTYPQRFSKSEPEKAFSLMTRNLSWRKSRHSTYTYLNFRIIEGMSILHTTSRCHYEFLLEL
jgi:hypothetical protein